MREALKMTYVSRFLGTDSNSLVQVQDDLTKGPGDRVRTILRMQLTGRGIQGDNTLEGNEEALVTYTDNVTVDQLRHAVRSGGKMSEQRVPFEVREEARMALQDWWSNTFDQWFFNQISGASGVTDTRLTGNNSATAPDTAHQIFAGSATAESNLSANSSQTFSLAAIDKAVLAARTLTPVIRPLNNQQEPGKHQFVMFITPEQHYDLRRSTATGEWADIQKYAMAAQSKADANPLFSGAIGMYNGCILHESWRLLTLPSVGAATGVAAGTADALGRAVLCGSQAAQLAFARGYSANRMTWDEELFDYGNQLGVATGVIAGLKKTVYNSKDFATLVISTAHSADAITASQRS